MITYWLLTGIVIACCFYSIDRPPRHKVGIFVVTILLWPLAVFIVAKGIYDLHRGNRR